MHSLNIRCIERCIFIAYLLRFMVDKPHRRGIQLAKELNRKTFEAEENQEAPFREREMVEISQEALNNMDC